MFHFALWISCAQHATRIDSPPSEPALENPSTEPATPPIDVNKIKERSNVLLTTGAVEGLQPTYDSATPIEINYIRQYPNGCFEQQEPVHSLSGQTIRHEVTVVDHSTSGGMCTMAIVPGGFTYRISDLQPGQYSGQIFLNGQLQLNYTFNID